MQTDKKIKWIDGRLVQGAYYQWIVDEHQEALDIKILFIIARNTLGYRKRYAYIKSDIFDKHMHRNTKVKQIKRAKELGLLEYRTTRGYTMYRLVLPLNIEENTLWKGEVEQKKEIKKTIAEGWE